MRSLRPSDFRGSTPADLALQQVLAEIDQTTRATLGSITIATMLRMAHAG